MPGRKTPSSSKRPISNLLSQLAEFSLGDEPPAREADNTAKNNQWSSRSSSRAAPSNRSQRQEAPPANSRIPALKGYGGLEEDDDDSWMNDSQGQDALNALLSKARTRESMQPKSNPVSARSSPSIPSRGESSVAGSSRFQAAASSPSGNIPSGQNAARSGTREDLPPQRSKFLPSRLAAGSSPSSSSPAPDVYSSPTYAAPSTVATPSANASDTTFMDLIRPLLQQSLGSPFSPQSVPQSDLFSLLTTDAEPNSPAFETLYQQCLLDVSAFQILKAGAYATRKKTLSGLQSQVLQIQSSLSSLDTPRTGRPSTTSSQMVQLSTWIKALFEYIQNESVIYQHLSAVLRQRNNSHATSFEDPSSKTPANSFATSMELARLRDAVREKEARIVQLESGSRMSPSSSTANTSTKKSSQKKGQGQSDSETDVEDEGSHAKRKPKWTPQNFSLSDQDVSDLATVLSNVDSELPYPTPSNLIASLKKIASQQQKGGRSDPSDGNSDRYANLQKEYRRIWSENEALTRKCEKLERSVGANNTPSRDMLEDLDRAKKSAEEYRRKYEASQRLLSEVESQLANAASSKASIRDHEKAVRYLEEKHQREISSLKSRLAQDLDDERGALKSRAEFEMRELASSHSSKIQALESQYKTEIESIKMELTGRDDDVRRKVKREFEDAKRGMELDHELAMDKLRSESRRELEQARRESEEKYKARIADLERKLQQSGLDAARSLERELEENRFQFRKDQETAILKHHEEIDRLREQSANEKSQIQGILDRTQAELDKVQAEFSREQDKLQLQVETLSLDIKKKETENKDVTRQLKEVDSKYTKQISEIETELNKLKSKHQDVTRQLELESAMVEQLKQDISDKETYINELGKTVLDYQKLHENFADVENRFKSELAKKDEIISSLEASVSAEKQKAKNMLEDSVEDKASALDQVERVKRRLAATEQELRRAKEFADEKEAEVLDMKRLLRSQNKQLESALGGSPSADTSMGYSEKKLNDALAEVGVLTSQVATLKKQLDSKEKEIFEVRIEASEAFDKATQLAQSQQDLSKMNSELDMMSQMVLELKTAKVQLMERVDNAEHRENILKSELSLIKSEVGRSKRGTQ